MDKQLLARKRNWFKFQLNGTIFQIEDKYLTDSEKITLNSIKRSIKILKEDFDNGSRQLGLKVPKHKCWCGKEGKYPSKSDFYKGLVCKKHREIL